MDLFSTPKTLFPNAGTTILRPYQAKDKKAIYEAWNRFQIIFYCLTTGGGKTQVGIDIAKDWLIKGRRVMWVAHRDKLIRQAYDTLSVNRIPAGIIMGDTATNYSLPCQVCSIQTISRRKHLPEVDLIIIDEGHHVTDENSYFKILQQYPNAKILFLSATPYRLSGEGFQNIVPGKETKLIIGSQLTELIAEGWLVDYDYFISHMPDMEGVGKSQGDWKDAESEEVMQLAPVVENYMRDAPGKCGLTFGVNVNHCLTLCSQYNYAGIPTEHIDSNTSDDDRKRIISDYDAQIVKMITNVNIYTEGADFGHVECVVDAAPTLSLSKYLQKFGRLTRAERGLVDRFHTAEERRAAIAASSKPIGIFLDMCGAGATHMLPDFPHNWEYYFKGHKKMKGAKNDEVMQMLVFEAEDPETGRKVRSHDPKEVEGLRLTKVTRETANKIINLKTIKDFDKKYAQFKQMKQIKVPGKHALESYLQDCKKQGILLVPEVWDYLKLKLVTEVNELVEKTKLRKQQVATNYKNDPTSYPLPMYNKVIENINDDIAKFEKWGVFESSLRKTRLDYLQDNAKQISEYMLSRNAK